MGMTAIAAALDGFVALDPSVSIEELSPRSPSIWSPGPPVRRGWLLLHGALEAAAVVPAGSGIQAFLDELREPARISDLVDPEDVGSSTIAWQLIDNLVRRGFAHRWRDARSPDPAELAQLRQTWRDECRDARRCVTFTCADPAELVMQKLRELAVPPRLTLAYTDEVEVLAGLAAGYRNGVFQAHEIIVEPAMPVGDTARACLVAMRAAVRLRGFDPEAIAALVADHIPVIVRLAELPADMLRSLHATRVTELELELDWSGDPEAILAQVAAIRCELGAVSICNFPSDDEIAGLVLHDREPPTSRGERAARARHLRDRALHLLELEGKIVWGQDPEAEERWVPSEDDLLPNRPELLGVGEGSVVVDVGGGFGRVARRLARHVGATGAVISIDKEPIISARARRFVNDLGVHAIQFRVGLGQRLPIADDSVDAAVLEWGGEIHRDGLLARCVAEMKRIVRPGKRIAITYRLCNILLEHLTEPIAPYPEIYPAVLEAVRGGGLVVVAQKFWAVQPRMSEAPLAAFEERYVPRLVDDLRGRTLAPQPPTLDLSLTLIAEKR